MERAMDQMRAQLAAVADLLNKDIVEARQRSNHPQKSRSAPIDPIRDGRELAQRSIAVFREGIGAN